MKSRTYVYGSSDLVCALSRAPLRWRQNTLTKQLPRATDHPHHQHRREAVAVVLLRERQKDLRETPTLAEAVIGEIPVTSRPGVTALVGEIPMSSSSRLKDVTPNLMSKAVKHVTEYTETGESSTCHQPVLFVNFHYRVNFMRENRYTC